MSPRRARSGPALCGSADTDGESFDLPQAGVEGSTAGADQEDGDSPETGSADTADEEQPSDNDRTEPPDVVFHAHVPRLPE
jgi:hypothetical protein